jgi:hypothetical protein
MDVDCPPHDAIVAAADETEMRRALEQLSSFERSEAARFGSDKPTPAGFAAYESGSQIRLMPASPPPGIVASNEQSRPRRK